MNVSGTSPFKLAGSNGSPLTGLNYWMNQWLSSI